MSSPADPSHDPIPAHASASFTALNQKWTVAEALDAVRQRGVAENILYCFISGWPVCYCEAPPNNWLARRAATGIKSARHLCVESHSPCFLEAGDTLTVLARNEFGERLGPTPALVGNQIYVRTDKHLFAFGETKR